MFRRRRRRDADLEEELRFHFDREAAERIEAGMSPRDAQASVRRDFGNVGQVKEITRQMWGWTSLERIGQDARYAVRALSHTPAFALTAVLSLALGIGANIASFSMADALLFRPLPVDRPSEVVAINGSTAQNPFEGVSYPDLRDLRENNRSFTGIAGYTLARFAFAPSADAVPQMKMGMQVSQGFFDILGVQPALGRPFTGEETSVPGRDPVAILGYDFWRQQFAGDPRVVGANIRLNGVTFNVIGVAPESFTGIDPIIRPALFVPVTMAARMSAPGSKDLLNNRGNRALNLRARLRPDVSLARAQAELSAFSTALEREFPDTDRDRVLRARTEFQLRVQQSAPTTAMVVMLLVLCALVLVISCANVASLLMARSRARSREFAIRISIGAGRARLVQQLLTESLILALAGGVAGVALAYGSIRYLAAIRLPTDTPIVISAQLDLRVLLFALAASIASAVLFGLAPALRAARPDTASTLKGSDGTPASRRREIGRNALVMSQVALALILLITSSALFDAFRRMLVVDPGIRTDRVMMFEFDPGMTGYDAAQSKLFYTQLIERVRGLAGVQSATLARAVPFRPNFNDQPVVPEGYELPRNQNSVSTPVNIVNEAYFETMRTGIVSGRGFTVHDTDASRRTAVVNQEFAKRYWSGSDPIGKRLRIGVDGLFAEVVGVARTAKYLSLAETPQPYLYLPFTQQPSTRMTMLVATHGVPAAVTDPVLRIVHALDANQPVYNVRPLDTYFEQGVLAPALAVMQMVGSTALIGVALALVGVYGLVAYSVARRTREIGIRMAIGAGRWTVITLVLRHGLMLSLTGVAAGLAMGYPVFRLLRSGLAGLGELSPLTLLIVPCGLILITLCACYIPAYRASRIDPLRALRQD